MNSFAGTAHPAVGGIVPYIKGKNFCYKCKLLCVVEGSIIQINHLILPLPHMVIKVNLIQRDFALSGERCMRI